MSEFFDARIMKWPRCGTKFASCEGLLCACYDHDEDLEYLGEYDDSHLLEQYGNTRLV